MKINIPKKIRKYIILYIILLMALYLVIEIMPRVTDIFETTQVLEPGEVQLTCEASGYVIKTETIATAPESADIRYVKKEGSAVRKNQKVVEVSPDEGDGSPAHKDLLQKLEKYDGLIETWKTPASGILSFYADGAEQALHPSRMDALTLEEVKDIPIKEKSLEEDHVSEGQPFYKITDDNKWYVVCWLKKSAGEDFFEGQSVKLQMSEDTKVNATIRSITKEKKKFKIIFFSDMYYRELPRTRELDFTIESSEQSGLLIDNECIIEKHEQPGVYVRNKNGDYYFVRVNVIETDGKESVISESSFYDPEAEDIVYTVSVYDEVLRQPEKQLKKDLKKEEKEQQNKTKQ
ncbi:MAG: hypothetical protein IJ109_04505 [Firmicutes bacterium]|nr:hypothetical protein [Bacillota bacterium]